MPLFKPEKEKETKTEELLDAIKNNLNPKKEKPTKFTWKGLAQFISMGDPTIPISSKMQRIKDLSNGNAKAIERDYTDFFERFFSEIFILLSEINVIYYNKNSAMCQRCCDLKED